MADVPVVQPVSGTGRRDLFVGRRGVLRALDGQQGLVAAVRLVGWRRRAEAGFLLGQQELGRSRGGAGRDALPPAAVHRLFVGREGDGKAVHHQVQLVRGATAARRQEEEPHITKRSGN